MDSIQITTNKDYFNNLPDCSICYQKMGKHKLTIDCGHSFHQKCLFQWINMDKRTCPLCREEFIELDFVDNVGFDINLICLLFTAFTFGGVCIFILECYEDD